MLANPSNLVAIGYVVRFRTGDLTASQSFPAQSDAAAKAIASSLFYADDYGSKPPDTAELHRVMIDPCLPIDRKNGPDFLESGPILVLRRIKPGSYRSDRDKVVSGEREPYDLPPVAEAATE